MSKTLKALFRFIVIIGGILFFQACTKPTVFLVSQSHPSERILYGIEKLTKALNDQGYNVLATTDVKAAEGSLAVIVGRQDDFEINQVTAMVRVPQQTEGFAVKSFDEQSVAVLGFDDTGTLYACLELADRVNNSGRLPRNIDMADQPEMVLRGACIGLQKTKYLPGRMVYEYPFTPENFPWFYDKEHWIRYLDMLVANRYNSLYLWNGHPFASLVRLDDYPYAVEVDEATFQLNEDMYSFIASEANKRGIWLIQMFYNILLSKPFAEHHGLATQDSKRGITPLIADYSRKSIAAFVGKYPNVGLLVTLGEAMNTYDDDVQWFTQTIIPGVKEGLAQAGITSQPPIVLRGHDTDAARVMKESLPIYRNLYTMYKYNGESLTTYEPRSEWASIPKALSELGSVHVANVHILANLEPFRYGSPDFIQKSVVAMHDIQGANGLHLYPQSSYWDWPYTADKTEPRTLQIDRDWIWYQAWGRYAWNCRRDRNKEIKYWTEQIDRHYRCGEKAAAKILDAYEQSGEIAPKLLRRFGISDGNRQSLMLGEFMSQLVNPRKWTLYQSFVESNGPKGELLIDYARKEWNKEVHEGETPPQIVEEVLSHSRLAKTAIDQAAPKVKDRREEFARLQNDIHCYALFADYFTEKVKAAELVLRYKYSNDIADLEQAVPFLENSVASYSLLTDLTKDTYLYCNSMQTDYRRIPIPGTDGAYKTWEELLPRYQIELSNFKANVERLKASGGTSGPVQIEPYQPVEVSILNQNVKRYRLQGGEKVNTDQPYTINKVAAELQNMVGVAFPEREQRKEGTRLKFSCSKPVKVLVGYFNSGSITIAQPPRLETNARGNDRGQADIRIANAMTIDGLYPVNVYTYHYEAGTHELDPGVGRVLILGFIDGGKEIVTHDAGVSESNDGIPVDWLFY